MSIIRFVLGVCVTVVVTGLPGWGAEFMVTRSDDVGKSPGDGLCETPAGPCTLRAAVQQANAHPGPDTSLPGGERGAPPDGLHCAARTHTPAGAGTRLHAPGGD